MGKKIRLAAAIRRINDRYGGDVTYQRAYMAGLANRIPVERDDEDRLWLVDEDNLPVMAKAFGLGPAKSKAKPKPTAKHNPTAKTKSAAKPARPRATRPAA
jgi:hypothetical protein